MKITKNLFVLLTLILALSVVGLFVSCTNADEGEDVENEEEQEEEIVVDYATIKTIEIEDEQKIGEEGFILSDFDISKVKILITYLGEDEETVTIPAKMSMVRAEDKAKLSVVGNHSITLLYGKYTLTFTLRLYSVDNPVYTIIFLDYDNSRLGDIQYLRKGEVAVIPTLETRDAVFLGWKKLGTDIIVTDFTFEEDTTLIASYASKLYTVNYYTKVGETVNYICSQIVPRGASALNYAPEIPIVYGYSQGHWEDETSMLNILSDNLSFYAVYEKDYVNATFVYMKYTDDDLYYYNVYWKVGEKTEGVTAPDDVVRNSDYVLKYWYTKHILNGTEYEVKVSFPYCLETETTFYAKYVHIDNGSEGIEYELIDEKYYISDYQGSDETVVIPRYHSGKEVVGIQEDKAPFASANIKKFVVAPENTYFRVYNDCLFSADLTEILVYPSKKEGASFSVENDTVTWKKIADYAFMNAESLQRVDIPFTVDYIGKSAFENCVSLSSIEIPNNIETIPERMFANDISLEKILFGTDSVLGVIGDYAFMNTKVSSITLPSTVYELGLGVFQGCYRLKTFALGSGSVLQVYKGALYGPQTKTASNQYYYLYAYPSQNTVSTTGEVEINQLAKVVRSGAFYMSNIINIFFEGASEISFEDCSIVCPTIQSMRFGVNCNGVTLAENTFGTEDDKTFVPSEFYCERKADTLADTSVGARTAVENDLGTYFGGYNKIKLYANDNGKQDFRLISDGYIYRYIDDAKGQRYTSIIGYRGTTESLTLPETLGGYQIITIEKYAFAYNTILKELILSKSKLITISEKAFLDCTSLTKVILCENLEEIQDYAFSGCTSLSLVQAEGRSLIQSFGYKPFENTPYIESEEFVILAGVLVAYNGTEKNVVVPASVSIIADEVFCDCDFIASLDFEEGSILSEVLSRTFSGCLSLEYIVFPSGVTFVGDNAFENCRNLFYVRYTSQEEISSGNNLYLNTGIDRNLIKCYVFTANSPMYTYQLTGNDWEQGYLVYSEPKFFGKLVYEWFVDGNQISFPYILTENETVFSVNYVDTESASSPLTYRLLSDGTYEVTGCTNSSLKYVVIPETHEGKKVAGIAQNAFKGSMLAFSLPSSITYIGKNAFTNTDFYKNYVGDTIVIGAFLIKYRGNNSTYIIGNDIRCIADGAFSSLAQLKTVYIGTYVTIVSKECFSDCTNLKNVFFMSDEGISSKVSTISENAFKNCISLDKIDFSALKYLNHVDNSAFDNTAFINSYEGDSIIIGTIFYKYIAKKDGLKISSGEKGNNILHIPNGIVYVNDYAFYDCTCLQYVYIPESVEVIGTYSFYNVKISKIYFPTYSSNLQKIDEYAFAHCYNVENIDLKDCYYLSEIGAHAFDHIQAKEGVKLSITIPERLTTMGEFAFADSDIYSVCFSKGSRLEKIPDNAFINSKIYSLVYYGDNYLLSVGKSAFESCENLTVFQNIYSMIETIETRAFFGCTELDDFSISEGELSFVGESAFEGTSVLHNEDTMTFVGTVLLRYNGIASIVHIPSSTTVIADGAFKNKTRLERVVFDGKKVVEIQTSAFEGCTMLSSIEIPSSVKKIAKGVFAGCTSLERIDCNTEGENFGYYSVAGVLFYWGENENGRTSVLLSYPNMKAGVYSVPKSITINKMPYDVIRVEDKAFYNCTNLTSLVFDDSLEEIGKYALYGCSNLTTLYLPEDLLRLEDGALSGASITEILIPEGTKHIGSGVFADCDLLDTITMPLADTISCIASFGKEISYVTISNGGVACEDYFNRCGAIKINIKSIDGFAQYSFRGCDTLTELSVPMLGDSAQNGTLLYLFGEITDSLTKVSISAGKTLFADACKNWSSLTEISLSPITETIEDNSFLGCTSLATINNTLSITNIGIDAFEDTLWLSNQPNGAVVVGKVLYKMKGDYVSSFVLDSNIIGIAPKAFKEKGITGFIANAVCRLEYIGMSAFENCSSLASVTISCDLKRIYNRAFFGCDLLDDFLFGISKKLPETVEYIGQSAFEGCELLDFDMLPDNITFVGKDALKQTRWWDNQSSGEVYIGKVLYSFKGSMTENYELEIEDNVVSVTDEAFMNMTNLASVVFNSKLCSIGDGAFSGTGIHNAILPTSLVSIGESAFADCQNLVYISLSTETTLSDNSFENVTDSFVLVAGKNNSEFSALFDATTKFVNFYFENESLDVRSSLPTQNSLRIQYPETGEEQFSVNVSYRSANVMIASVDASGIVSGYIKNSSTTIIATIEFSIGADVSIFELSYKVTVR